MYRNFKKGSRFNVQADVQLLFFDTFYSQTPSILFKYVIDVRESQVINYLYDYRKHTVSVLKMFKFLSFKKVMICSIINKKHVLKNKVVTRFTRSDT